MKKLAFTACALGFLLSFACQAKCPNETHKTKRQNNDTYQCKIKGNETQVFTNGICNYCGCPQGDHDNE